MKLSKISTFAALIATSVVGLAEAPAMAINFATDVYDVFGDSLGDGAANPADRFDVDNSLTKQDDETFYSMKLDESLIFGFGGKSFSSFQLWETTWGSRANWAESVKISVGNELGGDFTEVANIINNPASSGWIDVGGVFKYLKITDTTLINYPNSPAIADGNGFDIDAIAAKPVPEPTTMLGSAIAAGIGLVMKKKKKSQ